MNTITPKAKRLLVRLLRQHSRQLGVLMLKADEDTQCELELDASYADMLADSIEIWNELKAP